MKLIRTSAFAVAAILAVGSVQAATVEITLTEFSDRDAALAAQNLLLAGQTIVAYEDFERFRSYDVCQASSTCDASNTANYDWANAATPLATNVGSFSSILPLGTGGSSRNPEDAAIIRSNADQNNDGQPNYGRYDADLTGTQSANFIDSNDNSGMLLDTSTAGLSPFNWISFILTDFDDVGGVQFAVQASGVGIAGDPAINTIRQGNGDIFLATLYFSDFVQNVTVSMNIDRGDGFGADSFAISAVPLPASALFLLGGLGALGAAARRKRKAA